MKTKIKHLTLGRLLLILLAIAIGISMAFTSQIELALGLKKPKAEAAALSDVIEVSADSGELKVHSLDVGQADCTIIEFPDGKTMLIDGADRDNTAKNAMLTYIDTNLPNLTYFDYAILTHPDSDHCGSMDDVLAQYPAKIFYRPNVAATRTGFTDPGLGDLRGNYTKKDTVVYKDVIEVAYKENGFTPEVRVTNPSNTDYDIAGEGYSYTFYSPLSDRYTDWNDYSPIMLLSCGDFKMAFTGDAEAKNEEEFVAKVESAKTDGVTDKYDDFATPFSVDVIKAGHHGSRTSSSAAYLDVMLANGGENTYVILSCGEGNSYGHPHSEAVDRYKAKGVPESQLLVTWQIGNLEFYTSGTGLYYGETLISGEGGNQGGGNQGGNEGDNEGDETKVQYVYIKLGSIDLTWPILAWGCYAIIVVIYVIVCVATKVIAPEKGKKSRKGKK